MLVVEGVVGIDDSTRCRTRSTYSITITTTSATVVVVGLIE